jgi:hypothetical protein
MEFDKHTDTCKRDKDRQAKHNGVEINVYLALSQSKLKPEIVHFIATLSQDCAVKLMKKALRYLDYLEHLCVLSCSAFH